MKENISTRELFYDADYMLEELARIKKDIDFLIVRIEEKKAKYKRQR